MWANEMRNFMKIIFLVLLILIFYVSVGDCKTAEEVTIHKGDIYSITLNENPSTGYTWSVTSSDGLEIFSQKLTPSSNNSLGSAGTPKVKLHAVKTDNQTEAQNKEFSVSVISSDGLKIYSDKLILLTNCSLRAKGTREVKFQAVKTGKQNIIGKYQQPGKNLPIQNFKIVFNVI
ncbi:MAG: protease inhibitor I42 family protein [Methanosarcina sp.]